MCELCGSIYLYVLIDQKICVCTPWVDKSTCEAIGNDKSCGEGRKMQERSCSHGTQESCPNGEKEEQSSVCHLPKCPSKLI